MLLSHRRLNILKCFGKYYILNDYLIILFCYLLRLHCTFCPQWFGRLGLGFMTKKWLWKEIARPDPLLLRTNNNQDTLLSVPKRKKRVHEQERMNEWSSNYGLYMDSFFCECIHFVNFVIKKSVHIDVRILLTKSAWISFCFLFW